MAHDRAFRWALGACAALVALVIAGGGLALVVGAVAATGRPVAVGLGFAVLGSLRIVALALAIAVPIGVGAGVFLAEYAGSGPAGDTLRSLRDGLAVVPSIVYGVFALSVVAEGLGFGATGVAAGIALGVLALPGIVSETEAAVRRVPHRQRETALALGADRFQVVLRVVLPAASRGIAGGVLVATARVLGEAAPLLVLGAALTRAGGAFGALPHRLYVLAGGGGREAWLIATALALITVGLSLGAARLRRGAP